VSLVLGLIRSAEGAINVETRPDGGTMFRMYFPKFTDPAAGGEKKDTRPAESLDQHGLVLLADDEPLVRDLAAAQLKRLGFGAIAATDGRDAVEKFRARQDDIHLAVIDLSMPHMDGWQTMNALRQLRGDLPVILVSGYEKAQVKNDTSTEHPQVFLQKPYGIEELQAALGRVLNTGANID